MSDEPTCLDGPAREELNRLVKERIGWTWFEFGQRFDMSGAQGTLVSRGKRPFSRQNLAYLRRLAEAMEAVPLPGAMIDDGPLPSSRPPIVFGAPPLPKAVVVTPDRPLGLPALRAPSKEAWEAVEGKPFPGYADSQPNHEEDEMGIPTDDVTTALADAFIDAMADQNAGEAIQDALSTVADTLGISEQVVAQIKEALAAQTAETDPQPERIPLTD